MAVERRSAFLGPNRLRSGMLATMGRPSRYSRRTARLSRAAVAVRNRRAVKGDENAQAQDQERRSEEHTSELQSLMRISYAVFCLKKKNTNTNINLNIPH